MFNIEITLSKETVAFTDENNNDVKLGGVRVKFGPKLEKFITLEDLVTGRKSNLELLELVNPNLAQWYHNSSFGASVVLKELSSTNKSVIRDIYRTSENIENEL